MRILITGGAGYVGSLLVEKLLWDGHDVTVVDNFMWRQCSLGHLVAHPNLLIVRADARDIPAIGVHLKACEVFIPLAARVGAPLCDEDVLAARSTNYTAIREACHVLSPEQLVIYPNTNSGYGSAGAECTEETPLRPISVYGMTKCEAENVVMGRRNSAAFRLATVFGFSPRMRLDLLVNDFVHRAVTDRAVVIFEGHHKRNYVHVRDVADAFVHVLDNFDTMRGSVYNFGLSDANLSKLELCQEIAKQVPFAFVEADIGKDPDQRDYIVSNARIEATGFRATRGLQPGIAELIQGYRMLRNNVHGNVV